MLNLKMILGALIIILLCFRSVQVREIYSLHDRKVEATDHELEDVSENPALYAYDVDHERDHLNIHVFVNAEARNALSDPESLWEDDRIPYKLSEKYDAEEKATILKAMEEFENKTCIRFEPRGKEETPFILIEPGSSCSATVGRSEKGRVSLGKGCYDKGIIMHELMHILGFLHEHSRPDRDNYVEVNWENVDEKHKSNFEKNLAGDVQDGNIPYDYNSLMHYGAYNFAKNKSIPTIITLTENVTIGQRDGFSKNDIEKILERYGCKKDTDNAVSKFRMLPKILLHRTDATTQNPLAQSTTPKKGILSNIKNILGTRKIPKETTTTRKIKAETTMIKQMTEPKHNTKSIRSMLATAIIKLAAANRKITSNPSTASKVSTNNLLTMTKAASSHPTTTNLAYNTSLITLLHAILANYTKLSTSNRKIKPSETMLRRLIPSQHDSDFNRRKKRNVQYPTYSSDENSKEAESPIVVDSVEVEVESPMITERRTAVNKEIRDENSRTYFEALCEKLRKRYPALHKWLQHLPTVPKPILEEIVGDDPPLSLASSQTISPTEVKNNPSTEAQIVEKDNAEHFEFRKGHPVVPIPTKNSLKQLVPENCGDKPPNDKTCTTTSDCNRTSTPSATDVPFITTSNCVNSVTDTSSASTTEHDSLCVTTSMSTVSCISPVSGKTTAITPQSVVSEGQRLEGSTSSINSQTGISGKTNLETSSRANTDISVLGSTAEISKTSINALTETTHSDTSTVGITAQDRTSDETNFPLRTIFQGGFSTTGHLRITSGRSTVRINNIPTGSTLDTVNTDKIAPELSTLAETSSETKPSQITTLGRWISRSRDPGTNVPRSTKEIPNIPSHSTPETASSNAMDLELTKTESTTVKSRLPQRTTLKTAVSTSGDFGKSTNEITTVFELSSTSGNTAGTTEKIECPTEEIETAISTSTPFSPTTDGCPNLISHTSKGTTTDRVTSDMAIELTTPGSTSINTKSLEISTLKSKISTKTDIDTTSPRSTITINNTPLSTTVETSNSDEKARELTTPSRTSPDIPQKTTFENEFSISRDPGKSSSTISTSSEISSESANSQSTTEDDECENEDLETISTTETDSITTSPNPSNTPTGTASSRLTSDLMDAGITTPVSASTKAESLEKPTSESDISTSIGTVITSRRSTAAINITPTGTTEETTNSDAMALEPSTPSRTSPNRPERTTLERDTSKNEAGSSTPIIGTSLEISSESGNSQSTTEDFECDDDDLEMISTTDISKTTPKSPNTVSNTPTGTSSERLTSNLMDAGITTPVSASTKAESNEKTTLKSEISTSIEAGITTKSTKTTNIIFTSTTEETSNSEATAGELSTTSNSPQKTTFERDISISLDPIRSTPTISTSSDIASKTSISQSTIEDDDFEKTILTTESTPITSPESLRTVKNTPLETVSESANSDAMAGELTTPSRTSIKTNSPERTTLEREVSTSIDDSITSKSAPTRNNIITSGTTSESLASGATDNTPQRTTIESGISAGRDSTSKISSTSGIPSESGNSVSTTERTDFETSELEQGILTRITSSANTPALTTSESLTSDALASALTTRNSFSPKTESLGDKTSANLLSTSFDLCVTTPTAETCQLNPVTESQSTKNDISENDVITTIPDCKDFETDATGITSPEQGSSETNILQVTSSRISTTNRPSTEEITSDVTASKCSTLHRFPGKDVLKRKDSKNSEDSDEESTNTMTESENIETDTTGDTEIVSTTNHEVEISTLPFEFAVQPGEHSIPYHKIRMYRTLQERTALSNTNRQWPDGIVPYEFSDKYDDMQKGFILEGMEEFKNKTCVRFVERTDETAYVLIEPEDKCKAGVGRQPGMSKLTLSDGCYLKGTIIHELMHVLSFVHEQNRPDRDSFVMVIWDNIIEDAKPNFKKHTEEEVTTLNVPYDYDSVMHYKGNEFAINPDRPTLVALQSGVTLGDKDGFSEKDLLKVNKLYDCPMKRGMGEKKEDDKKGKDEKKDVSEDVQALFQKVLKYFEMNFQRLFRSILRTIQKFRPIILNKSKDG